MIDASQLPTVPNEVLQATASQVAGVPATTYARAPEASGPQQTGGRPQAGQGGAR